MILFFILSISSDALILKSLNSFMNFALQKLNTSSCTITVKAGFIYSCSTTLSSLILYLNSFISLAAFVATYTKDIKNGISFSLI